jgi:hypothetical protein
VSASAAQKILARLGRARGRLIEERESDPSRRKHARAGPLPLASGDESPPSPSFVSSGRNGPTTAIAGRDRGLLVSVAEVLFETPVPELNRGVTHAVRAPFQRRR